MENKKNKALIYIILAGIFWGTSGIFVKLLSPYGFQPLQFTAVRGTVAFIALAVYALMFRRELFRVTKRQLFFSLGVGLSIFATATLYYLAMQKTTISVAVVLMDSAPLYVMLFSVVFLRERLTRIKVISVFMMILGCVLVSGIIGNAKFDTVGILIGILSGISYGAYNIITKLAMKESASAITLNMYSFAFMAAIALAVCNPRGILESAEKNPPITIPLLIGIGILTSVLPYVLYSLSMKSLPATTVSALSIVEPMAATLFSIFLFGEIPDVFGFIGIALITVAIFVLGKYGEE